VVWRLRFTRFQLPESPQWLGNSTSFLQHSRGCSCASWLSQAWALRYLNIQHTPLIRVNLCSHSVIGHRFKIFNSQNHFKSWGYFIIWFNVGKSISNSGNNSFTGISNSYSIPILTKSLRLSWFKKAHPSQILFFYKLMFLILKAGLIVSSQSKRFFQCLEYY